MKYNIILMVQGCRLEHSKYNKLLCSTNCPEEAKGAYRAAEKFLNSLAKGLAGDWHVIMENQDCVIVYETMHGERVRALKLQCQSFTETTRDFRNGYARRKR